jgi:hypothetical protein
VHEVTALLPVLEQQRPVAVEQTRREDREHARVWIGERLARAVHVEEAERDGRQVVGVADQQAQALLRVLVERIDRAQVRTLVLGRGQRAQEGAVGIHRVPLAGLQPSDRAFGGIDDPACGRLVAAFAINAHR